MGSKAIDNNTLYDPTISCAYYFTVEFKEDLILYFYVKCPIYFTVGPNRNIPGAAIIDLKQNLSK